MIIPQETKKSKQKTKKNTAFGPHTPIINPITTDASPLYPKKQYLRSPAYSICPVVIQTAQPAPPFTEIQANS
jgi:hypothetical protein